MADGETPGIGGVPGIKKSPVRAPKAWAVMIAALHHDLPASLRETARTRRAIRNVAGRRRKV